MKPDDHEGCLGCLGFIALCIIGWALMFGVNVNGKHYGLSGCGCGGVDIGVGAK